MSNSKQLLSATLSPEATESLERAQILQEIKELKSAIAEVKGMLEKYAGGEKKK